MNNPESNYRAWVGKAESDLLNIENNIVAASVPWDTVCFHAQQAAEKLLKAFLVYHGQKPEYTHDLVILLTRCGEIESDLIDLKKDCENLTLYAVASRYPGDPKVPSEEEGRGMKDAAHRVRHRILALLPDAGGTN